MFDMRKIQEKTIYENIKAATGEQAAYEIVYGNGAQSMDDASWVKEAMKRMEAALDKDTCVKVRMGCQCGYGMEEKKKLVEELTAEADGMDSFAASKKAREAGLFTENGELYLSFPFCPCPMLADVDRLETKTWCYCTMGYSKKLFEEGWGCKVAVELIKAIKAGDDMCLMKITPLSKVW